MNRLAGVTFGLALGLSMAGLGPAQAGPFSHAAELRSEGALPIQDVASRQARRNRALAAGAIIGGAIVGGAIIAESQRRRDYYVDDGYYQDRRYNSGTYYAPAQYYRGPQQPLPPAYFNQGGEAGRPPADFYSPGTRYYQPAPRYYGPGPGYYGNEYYYETPRRRGRTVRDPAGGGSMR
ncbi:MAG: hypothetical protein O9333_06405 [Beijerinckiaceae bacterium]|jgi:hypothetical protein|nr:hypothetical protein [Beijerinckiaceae bacterium]